MHKSDYKTLRKLLFEEGVDTYLPRKTKRKYRKLKRLADKQGIELLDLLKRRDMTRRWNSVPIGKVTSFYYPLSIYGAWQIIGKHRCSTVSDWGGIEPATRMIRLRFVGLISIQRGALRWPYRAFTHVSLPTPGEEISMPLKRLWLASARLPEDVTTYDPLELLRQRQEAAASPTEQEQWQVWIDELS